MVSSDYVEFLKELTGPLGGVSMRKMFGGLSIYQDGLIFALVIEETLYLKADAQTISDFEAEGCGPFVYHGKDGRVVQMPYWRAPERLFDEPDEFIDWARKAVSAARRVSADKEQKKPKPRKKAVTS